MSTIRNKNQKVHSILMGKKVRKFYKLDNVEECYFKASWGKPRMIEDSETIERVKIGEYDLPLLNEKDEIFLSEQGVYATIQKVTTGTDGNIYYNVSYVAEYIDELVDTKNKLLSEFQYLKQIYDTVQKQEETRIKSEKIINETKILEIKEKVKEIKEWQQNNLDKIKGIIVNEIPKDKDGKPAVTVEVQENIVNNMRLSVPREYIVISSMNKITYLDCTGQNLSIEMN